MDELKIANYLYQDYHNYCNHGVVLFFSLVYRFLLLLIFCGLYSANSSCPS